MNPVYTADSMRNFMRRRISVHAYHAISHRMEWSCMAGCWSQRDLIQRKPIRGLLHDLYHYDWRNLDKEERPIEGRHCAVHPQIALENARKATSVNTIIEDAIVHHMWPMTLHCPKTKEGWVLQAVDKYCAISEILLQGGRRVRYSRLAISLAALLSFSIR